MAHTPSPGNMRPAVALASTEELKGELLRVRRELASVDAHLAAICRELSVAADSRDKARMDDARNLRQSLWKDKEQLRVQETIFLKLLYDPSSPAIHTLPADSLTTHPTVPVSTHSECKFPKSTNTETAYGGLTKLVFVLLLQILEVV